MGADIDNGGLFGTRRGNVEMIDNELMEMIVEGAIIEVYFNEDNPSNETRHILAVVEGRGPAHVVYEAQAYGRWYCRVLPLYQFQCDFEGGFLCKT